MLIRSLVRAAWRSCFGSSRFMLKRRISCLLLVVLVLPHAQAGDAPAYKLLRYDESYTYLFDPSQRSDYLDAIKFIPLTTNGDWYLTLGGEIRERYEYFHNSSWGRGPQDDNGYLLQRYMVHADAHFGDYFRFFTQFKSSLEDGRNGGPRPTDRDDF